MIAASELDGLPGCQVLGTGGERVGRIVAVYEATDDAEGTFVTVTTGLFGSGSSFVPLAGATLSDGRVVVPYSRALVKDAPRLEPDEQLSPAEEDRLYQHYSAARHDGLAGTVEAGTVEAGTVEAGTVEAGTVEAGTVEAGTVEAGTGTGSPAAPHERHPDRSMVRSQERLHVGTERVESGRVRLRKRIVTVTETRDLPLAHDEAVVERQPANREPAPDGARLGEAEGELILHREQPVVGTRTVAVERVGLAVTSATEQASVTEHVRKENVELVTESAEDAPSA